MRTLLMLCLLAVAFTQLPAQRTPVTGRNIALAAAATTLLLLDRGQTEHISREGRRELNPILGPHPSQGRVNTYFAVCAIGEIGIGLLLHDDKARNLWWGGIALVELVTVMYNASIHIPVRF